MSSPSSKLYRLRGIFVVYFVLKSLAGAVVAWSLIQSAVPDRIGHFEIDVNFNKISPGFLLFFSLAVATVILVIALLVFGQLLKHRNWARVLLLVIGWLTVISAIFSLLASAQVSDMGSWIAQWLPDMDWQKLMNFDRIQKLFEMLFWGYLVFVLQFDAEVKNEFVPSPPANDSEKDIGG
jgi:hypothetical protein